MDCGRGAPRRNVSRALSASIGRGPVADDKRLHDHTVTVPASTADSATSDAPAAHRNGVESLPARTRQTHWPLNPSQEILECQFTNMPVGFSFHAHTCSV